MPAMQEGEEGDVLARKGLADAGRTRRPDRWLRRPGGQGLKVSNGHMREGKGGLTSRKETAETAGRKEGCAGHAWSAGGEASWQMWGDGGGALALVNAR